MSSKKEEKDLEVHWQMKVKHSNGRKRVYFELPYWKFNLLCHNLDLMHIEKNVCDNVIYTLLNEQGKTKDHLNAHKDL